MPMLTPTIEKTKSAPKQAKTKYLT